MNIKLTRITNNTTKTYGFKGIEINIGDLNKVFYFDKKYRLPINIDRQKYDEGNWYYNLVEIIIYNLSKITIFSKTVSIDDSLLI